MALMNPYYTHESSVGAVYDVAHFSRFKSVVLAFAALCFAVAVGTVAAYLWNPDLLVPHPSEVFADAHQEAKDLMREHPRGVKIGVAVAALFATLCLVICVTTVFSAISGNFYVRVGQQGISLRVPGLIVPTRKDFAWADIAKLTVVQEKRFGSLSRNSGNIGGELQVRMMDRTSYVIPLHQFREDAWLIYERIKEARQMQLAAPHPEVSDDLSDGNYPLASATV